MKTTFTLKLLFLILTSSLFLKSAHASGCGGAWWDIIKEVELKPTEIKTSKNQLVVKVRTGEAGWGVSLKNITLENKDLNFYVGLKKDTFNEEDLNNLKKILSSTNFFLAKTNGKTETNEMYDDCLDLPEDSLIITTSYRIFIALPSKKIVSFYGSSVEEIPSNF